MLVRRDGDSVLGTPGRRPMPMSSADVLAALGGTPVTLAFGEVVPALQNKTVDCAITGTMSGNTLGLHLHANYLYPMPIGWGMAFFEYVLQVPANRIGHMGNGGPFSLVQLKVIQEAITLVVFVVFSLIAFKNEALRWNHALAGVLLIAAVWLVFKK